MKKLVVVLASCALLSLALASCGTKKVVAAQNASTGNTVVDAEAPVKK